MCCHDNMNTQVASTLFSYVMDTCTCSLHSIQANPCTSDIAITRNVPILLPSYKYMYLQYGTVYTRVQITCNSHASTAMIGT